MLVLRKGGSAPATMNRDGRRAICDYHCFQHSLYDCKT